MKMCSDFSRTVFEQFLAGGLPEAEERTLAAHAAKCPTCLEVLRSIEAELLAPQLEPLGAQGGSPALDSEFLSRLRHAGPASAAEPKLPEVSGYEVFELLGSGGMGAVYRAHDRQLGRDVALKFLRLEEDPSGDEGNRLRAEARVVASLKHPHIVQIYAIGEHNGGPFLSLELCPGGSLKDRLTGAAGQLSPRLAAWIIEVLAQAVHHAHQHGIVHRDLKPANVLLAEGLQTPLEDCAFKVADFGLAKRLEGSSARTQSGAILGTPDYMAPEQARADKDIGPAADIHALGAMLYEMLSGQPPYKADNNFNTLLRTIHDDAVPLRRLRPSLSLDLETICLKCLEKEPGQRYDSAEALADDLARFRAGEAILARPPSLLRRGGRWLRQHRLSVSAAAAVVLITVASLVAWQRIESSRAREKETRANLRESLRQTMQEFDPHTLLHPDSKPVRLGRLKEDLEAKAALYENIISAGDADMSDREDLGDIYVRLGWIEAIYGDKGKAADLIEKGRSHYAELSASEPRTELVRVKRANASNDLGLLAAVQNQREEGEAAYIEAIRVREQLVADFPENLDHLRDLAVDFGGLGELRMNSHGDKKGAETAFSRGCKLQRQCIAADPERWDRRPSLAGSLIRWGVALNALGQSEDADKAFGEALSLLDEYADSDLWDLIAGSQKQAIPPVSASSFRNQTILLGELIASSTTTKEAGAQHMVDHYSALVAANPGQAVYKRRLARSYFWSAMTGRFSKGDGIKDTMESARRGAALYEELCSADPTNAPLAADAGQLFAFTAGLLLAGKAPAEVAHWCDRGLAFLDAAVIGDEHKVRARKVRHYLVLARATARVQQERHLEALRDFEEAIQCDPAARTRQPIASIYPLTVWRARGYLVRDLLRKERFAESVAYADALAKLPHIPGEALYDGACASGGAAGAEKEPILREKYAARSVELLRLAFAAGFGKDPLQKGTGLGSDPVQWMKDDTDLVAVRGRADYQKFLADLTRKP